MVFCLHQTRSLEARQDAKPAEMARGVRKMVAFFIPPHHSRAFVFTHEPAALIIPESKTDPKAIAHACKSRFRFVFHPKVRSEQPAGLVEDER